MWEAVAEGGPVDSFQQESACLQLAGTVMKCGGVAGVWEDIEEERGLLRSFLEE